MKILIVDDESIIRKGIRCIIERAQRQWAVVGEATDGIEALGMIEKQAPDVLITDVRMPEMDGIQLAEQIQIKYPHILMIIISGYSEFQYAKDAMRYGVIEYIVKPVRPEEMVGAFARAEKIIQERAGNGDTPKRAANQYRKVIEVAMEYIREHYASNLKLKELADVVYMNANYFCDLFKQETGMLFSDYLTQVRIEEAQRLLRVTLELKNYQIAEMVGYRDPKYFSQVFKRTVGVTPSEYRKMSNT